ncbi:MAG: FG-GAP repeat protein [Deltaproteobacteria bacterium]|nr:FG-GAP repeat protein [Deltaproteobacteria bacterium]
MKAINGAALFTIKGLRPFSWAIFMGSASGLKSGYDWHDRGEYKGDQFGMSVAGAGDVNGDGYDDWLVGAPGYHTDDRGAVYVYYGNLDGQPALILEGPKANLRFGSTVSGCGDVNGDGYDDVMLTGEAWPGVAGYPSSYVHLGSPRGLSEKPSWFIDWGSFGSYSQWGSKTRTSGAGDVNGDGFDDVLVGRHHDGDDEYGVVYLFYGSKNGLGGTPGWTWFGETLLAYGSGVLTPAPAGDIDGDGYADFVVGAVTSGYVYVFMGSPDGPGASPDWSADGQAAADGSFGFSVASAGDVNGDGKSDLVVGAPNHSETVDTQGAAFVYYGQSARYGLDTEIQVPLEVPSTGGISVAVFSTGRNQLIHYEEIPGTVESVSIAVKGAQYDLYWIGVWDLASEDLMYARFTWIVAGEAGSDPLVRAPQVMVTPDNLVSPLAATGPAQNVTFSGFTPTVAENWEMSAIFSFTTFSWLDITQWVYPYENTVTTGDWYPTTVDGDWHWVGLWDYLQNKFLSGLYIATYDGDVPQ